MENELGDGGMDRRTEERKENEKRGEKQRCKTEQGQRVSPHPLVIYSSFQSSHKNH